MEFFLLNVFLKIFLFLKVCDGDQVELEAMVLDYPKFYNHEYQRWSRGHKARGQGQGQEHKKTEAKDSLSEDRTSRGQGQECLRPRTKDTSASALQKKRRSSQKFFKRSPQKNAFQKIFQALHKILTIQKIVLSSSRGQANFRGLEASRPRPRT